MDKTVKWLDKVVHVRKHGNVSWNDVPGVYIFTGLNQQGHWVALYVGMTSSFADRIPGHEKWGLAESLGATHIHARVIRAESARATLEKSLRIAYEPPLNLE